MAADLQEFFQVGSRAAAPRAREVMDCLLCVWRCECRVSPYHPKPPTTTMAKPICNLDGTFRPAGSQLSSSTALTSAQAAAMGPALARAPALVAAGRAAQSAGTPARAAGGANRAGINGPLGMCNRQLAGMRAHNKSRANASRVQLW